MSAQDNHIDLPDILLFGAGKLGWHLGQRLKERGCPLVQVFSRDQDRAAELGSLLNVAWTNKLEELRHESGLVILAVRDDAILTVAQQLHAGGFEDRLIVHTSGAMPLAALAEVHPRAGVLYPLQTFSRQRKPDFEEIPFCIAAREPRDEIVLSAFASRLSQHVHLINDEQRLALHVAAVFANNFTNHMYHISWQLLEGERLPFELLLPLIRETAARLSDGSPASMQTGPASRGDSSTLQRHLDWLEQYPAHRELYQLLSQRIAEASRKQ
ncbi:MAG: hypothetical protein RI973_1140 [Bacteroidota bacterium]|jgi:predicted short-subunit dehydrogenase-like oxidoreductase (DUF2520 family)